MAFLESTDFEDAIRNAISIGGDSDTLAAITGGIAEAYYGIPRDLAEKALGYLSSDLLETVLAFYGEDGIAYKKQRVDISRLTRIQRMEQIKKRAEKQAAYLARTLDDFEAMEAEIAQLKEYYSSGLWMADFSEDEAGRIPGCISRGVLSEDGVYDLLAELESLRQRFEKLGKRNDKRRNNP